MKYAESEQIHIRYLRKRIDEAEENIRKINNKRTISKRGKYYTLSKKDIENLFYYYQTYKEYSNDLYEALNN